MTRTVVVGPPGAGKTTFVESNRKPGDLVWDWDAVSVTLFGNISRQKTDQQMRVLMHMAASLRTWLASNEYASDVWVIVSDRIVGQQIARQVRATVHEVEATKQECIERVTARDSGCGYLASRLKAIEAWFNVGDVVGCAATERPKRFVPGRGVTDLEYERTPWRKEDKAFYNSARWKRFRLSYLREHPLCDDCFKDRKTTAATELHHRIRRRDNPDLAFEPDNIAPLCTACHSKRTRAGE